MPRLNTTPIPRVYWANDPDYWVVWIGRLRISWNKNWSLDSAES